MTEFFPESPTLLYANHKLDLAAREASKDRMHEAQMGLPKGKYVEPGREAEHTQAQKRYFQSVTQYDDAERKLDATLRTNQDHYEQNEVAYHDQAVADAQAAGVELKVPQSKE